MALAPFFERVYGAVGRHLAVSRDTLESALREIAPVVSLPPAGLSGNDATIAELVTNLLARLYPRIALIAPAAERERLSAVARGINPEIEILDDSTTSPRVCVGAGEDTAICPAADGWVTRLLHGAAPAREAPGAYNPFSAGAAAALAVAELFRRVLLHSAPEKDLQLSLLDYSATAGEGEELPECVLDALYVGVGAVGNGGLWVLSRHPRVSGKLTLVDHEDLSLLNLQRYVLGGFSDVGRRKVDLGQSQFRSSDVQISTFAEPLDSYVDRSGGRVLQPVICISLDNVEGRRSAQALLPRLLVNGWTGEAGLGVSWHDFAEGRACLACLYHPTKEGPSAPEQAAAALGLTKERAALLWLTGEPLTDADLRTISSTLGVSPEALGPWRRKPLGDVYTDVVCGAVPLDLKGVNKLEAVPLAHQSMLSGVLMAAELVKRSTPQLAARVQAETLLSWDDVLKAPPRVWTRPAAATPGCICGDEIYRAVHAERWHEGQSSKTLPSCEMRS